MPQITLSVPQEKLPLLQEFLQALGIDGNQLTTLFGQSSKRNRSNTTYSEQQFSWEYNCNELEFE